MELFKIRCSAISQIMTRPKTKAQKEAGELSQTAKTYCENWLKERLYKRTKEFSTKHTAKGTYKEEDNIEYLNGIRFTEYKKNEQHFQNDFITGTPDIICLPKVIDIKSSWDPFTFPLFETEPAKNYVWQLQGYMDLTGAKVAELIYVLSDTPDYIIESEAKRFAWANNIHDDLFDVFAEKMRYPDVDPKLKVKSFAFNRNDNSILEIYERVAQCRKYIKTLI